MAIIKDGKNGNTAGVTDTFQLKVLAETRYEISQISRTTGAAFNVHAERTLVAGSTFETICTIKYTGEKTLIIDHIMFSREDVALTSNNGQSIFEVLVNVPRVSGGDAVIPHSLNSANQSVLDAEVYSGTTTLVTDEANEREIMDFAVDVTYNHDFKGGLILGNDDEISIIGKSKNIGDTLHLAIFAIEV